MKSDINDESTKICPRKNKPQDYQRAQSLRQSSSLAERLLWNDLRNLAKDSVFEFRRQHPIHPYIVDFVCLKSKLIIEIDGESHDARVDYDRKRSEHMQGMGFSILRCANDDVYRNREGVMLRILQKAEELRPVLHAPLP